MFFYQHPKMKLSKLLPLFYIMLLSSSCNKESNNNEPINNSADYTQMAVDGVNNLIKNFWVIGEGIRPTWGGTNIPDDISDKRGQLWERSMMIFPMYHLYKLNNDADLHSKLLFEADRLKSKYEESILTQAGHYFNTAIDDCAWNAMLYMIFYDLTKDEWYINIAKKLIDDAVKRWTDSRDGALYYRDGVNFKSLYTVGLVIAMLNIYDVTGEQDWLDKAKYHHRWMVSILGRSDGLFWTDVTSDAPHGIEAPDRIYEANSVSFLTGNQAMCILAKRLYDIEGNENYITQIKKTSRVISSVYNRGGVYLNDRDAFTNGVFMSDFVKKILVNPQFTFSNDDLLLATAESIVTKGMTPDGYYGGSWQGPTGKGSVWTECGSIPEQVMTSSTAVHVLVAAAILSNLE